MGVRRESPLYELWRTLFYNCEAGNTGTLFIATKENRSGQIVLHKGRLIGAAYNGEYNLTALMTLTYLQDARFSYTADLIFPIPETLLPEESALLLEQLGFQDYLNDLANESAHIEAPEDILLETGQDNASHIQSQTASSKEIQQAKLAKEATDKSQTITYMYRGQKVTKAVVMQPHPTSKTHSSVKIYRGQVVQD